MAKNAKNATVNLSGYKGQRVMVEVLYEFSDAVHSARVTCPGNRLKAYLEYAILDANHFPSRDALEDILHNCRIRFGVDREALEMVQTLLREQGGKTGPVQVARGQPAVGGEDGRLDMLVNPSSEKARYRQDEQGKIDYHETYLIENAYAGKDIAIIRPPTRGTLGKDIFGNILPTSDGAPFSIRLGSNVELDEKSGHIKAQIDGRVVFENNVISVVDQYVIEGDVALSIGNVNFVGEVTVRGNVLDDFTIRGKKAINIAGDVGAAKLMSDGDITIRGGVAGKGRSLLKSQNGWVRSKYLNNTRVESYKGVAARNEIVNSRIYTSGPVLIPRGAIISGEVTALQGVEAHTLGSTLGVMTRVGTGLDWVTEDHQAQLRDRIELLDRQIAKLTASVEPVINQPDRTRTYAGAKKKLMKDVLDNLKTFRREREQLKEELVRMAEGKHAGAIFQVNVRKMLHMGVLVRLGAVMEHIRKDMKGPLSLMQTPDGEKIQPVPLKALPVEMEEEEEDAEDEERGRKT